MAEHAVPKGTTRVADPLPRALGHAPTCQCAGTGRWFTAKTTASGGTVITGYGICRAPQLALVQP